MTDPSVGASGAPNNSYPTGDANAMGEQRTMNAPTPGGYDYGPPPTVVRDTNYISDENLLVWLAQKQDGIYGELRDHIDMSKARSKLMADLSHVKSMLDADMPPNEVEVEMKALLAAYAGTPFEEDLTKLFAGPLAAIEFARQDPGGPTSVVDAFKSLEKLSSEIESKVDALGRDDQLELIKIQSLTADAREAAQLASNLLSSSNQASNTIVGNIAR